MDGHLFDGITKSITTLFGGVYIRLNIEQEQGGKRFFCHQGVLLQEQ